MQIVCPGCGRRVPARDANLERMVAKCETCDEIFPIDAVRSARAGRERPPRPRSITVEGDIGPEPGEPGYRDTAHRTARGRIAITRRWFSPMTIFVLAFAILWDCLLVGWYAGVLSTPDPPLMTLLFPLLHVGAGAFITYQAVTGLVNRTVIAVDARTLSVTHGPLPWPGNVVVDVERIGQLFVRRRVHRGKNGSYSTFALCADLDGEAIDLLRGLRSVDEARYVEQVVESHLSIVDDPSADQA